MSEFALCALVSAVSEGDIDGHVVAWFADGGSRAAVAQAVDALALLDAGQSAGDAASWSLHLLANKGQPQPPAWWRGGRCATREIQVAGRWQSVTVYCCEVQ